MEQKIDRRIGYYLMLDDETAPIDRNIEGVDPTNMLAYDIGFCVCDKRGNIYEEGSLVIAEIFYGERDRMNNSYYAWKMPKYYEAINNGTREVVTLRKAQQIITSVMEKYGTNVVVGHNIFFDLTSLNRTAEYLWGEDNYFFPYDTVFYDTLKMARSVIVPQKSYQRFCEEYGYFTSSGRPRATAEILGRYIFQDEFFNEEHQGLDDCRLQVEIMKKCFAQHKKMDKVLF